MKKKNIIYLIVAVCLTVACDNTAFIDGLYVEPRAAFEIDKEEYNVFEAVKFNNLGKGQKFVVYPGDTEHVYGETGNTGYATNADGTYSYPYKEPGEYTAVWIASSIKANGDIVMDVDSVRIKVVATDGGLTSFTINRINRLSEFGSTVYYDSRGVFVSDNNVMCPMPYTLWSNSSIKRTLTASYVLESDLASLYWVTGGEDVALVSGSTNKIFTFYEGTVLVPQKLKTVTSSGVTTEYEVAAVVIPEFTSFRINGVEAVKTRIVTAYNKFSLDVELPAGTDLKSLVPEFVVMADDANLIGGDKKVTVTVNDVQQTSGVTSVDFSSTVEYKVVYEVPGNDGFIYSHDAYFEVNVTNN